VKGHSDKATWESIWDLQDQGLNRDEIYNVWCEKLAREFWAPAEIVDHDPDPTPVEKGAVYSLYPSPHKIIGSLTTGIYD
jgi:hypothetical protein